MSRFDKIEYITGYDWDNTTGGSATAIDDFLDEGLETPDEETVDYTFGDGEMGQDGVRVEGQIFAIGSNLPSVGTRTWIRVTQGALKTVIGGPNGCRIRLAKSGPKKLGDGPPYTIIKYSTTGSASGDCITTES